MSEKQVLLLSYKFPPVGGVGTRRWAKFCRYLAEREFEVHVVTARYPYVDVPNWSSDVDRPGIVRHDVQTDYPALVYKKDPSLIEKIKIRAFHRFTQPREFYLDAAQGWERWAVPFARELVEAQGIRNVIATGPPSTVHYVAALLKVEVPEIHLVQDYRDSWNDDIDYRLGARLTPEQKYHSVQMEHVALTHADRVVFNTRDVLGRYTSLYAHLADKFTFIPNGYDPTDFDDVENQSSGFSVIYTGSLGYGRDEGLRLLAGAVAELDDPFVNENLVVDLYSNLTPDWYGGDPLAAVYERNFRFHSYVPAEEIPHLIGRHAFGLSINAPIYAHAVGSKVFDYLALAKGVIHIAPGGELSADLRDAGHYVSSYAAEDARRLLERMRDDYRAGTVCDASFEDHRIDRLTDRVVEELRL